MKRCMVRHLREWTHPLSEEEDQLSTQLNPQENGTLAGNQPKTKGASGNCWRDHSQRSELMNPDEQLRTVCEGAGFMRPVSEGMYCRIGEDVTDGFGNLIATCREHTHTHYPGLIEILKLNFGFRIIPRLVQFVMSKIICHNGRHGIEIQIPSSSGENTNVWVAISRGPNRYVDELRYRDPEHSLEEADYECMQDTDQQQATVQLEMSDDHIPIPERKLKDIIATEFSHRHTWESQISKFVSKLVRHENYRDTVSKGWKP